MRFLDKFLIKINKAFLQVIGYVHPPNYVMAIPKYIPTKEVTPWSDGKMYYKRVIGKYGVHGLREAIKYGLRGYVQLKYDSMFDSEIPLIDIKKIDRIYDPREILKSSLKTQYDHLKSLTIELINKLHDLTGLPLRSFGITGSILLGIHNQQISDIDITVFGIKNVEEIKNIFLEENNEFRPSLKRLKKWLLDSRIHGLSPSYAFNFYKRKWYRGVFKSREFSIIPIMFENEIRIKYGDFIVKSLGPVLLKAKVKNIINPFFLPFKYAIKCEEIIEGVKGFLPSLLVSYDGFYMDVFKEGDEIIVFGLLQKVYDLRESNEYYRVVIGVRELPEAYVILLN